VKLQLHQNSLFAVLMRSPWWISAALAAAVFGGIRYFLEAQFALFAAAPFILITLYVAWKQFRAPSSSRIAATLERVRAMSWEEFSAAMEQAYRRDGFTVTRLAAGADFELVQGSRSTLVACKRWKARTTGIEPLRELEAVRRTREVGECIYVATGEVTAQARAFATERNIRVLEGAALAERIGV
jgi:restriction system protein